MHTAINTIIQRALSAGNIPSRLEPSGLYRSDGKCPDGITIAPWERGRTLIWDTTCIVTFAPSYIHSAVKEAGLVAEIAEIRKRKNYEALSAVHVFTPITVETSGVFGPETRCFLHTLASRMRSVTNEVKSHFYLTQQLSIAIQRGNALSILGTHVHMVQKWTNSIVLYICMFLFLWLCCLIIIIIIIIIIILVVVIIIIIL